MPAPRSLPRLALALALAAAARAPARAQPDPAEPLRLNALVPGGVRGSVTESPGVLRVELLNVGPDDRDARVVVFYPDRPDERFARDLSVPARSAVVAWLPVGPAPAQSGTMHRDLRVLLYDRTGGTERQVPPPSGERVGGRPVPYSPREPTTALLLDEADPGADESLTLVRCAREAAGLSETVVVVRERFLPPHPEAFDGIDLFVVAGGRLADDPAGARALRRWVEQGGKAWVLLDRAGPAGLAPLLGDAFDLRVLERVGLTTIRLHRSVDDPASAEPRDLDRPAELVRVAAGTGDVPIHTANGWPASFVRSVGRGQVFVTTLEGRAWHRPRGPREPKSRFEHYPELPVALNPLADLAVRLHPRDRQADVPEDALRELLVQEVGYSVLGRGPAAAVFGVFLAGLVGTAAVLRRSRRPELAGWLGPAAAAGAAAVFVGLGESSRRAVPPTAAVAEVVEAVPGSGAAVRRGVFAVYQPDGGPVPLGSAAGAELDLDAAGLEGQTRTRATTDLAEWHWEGLNLPAGLRAGRFRATTREPLAAAVRFGPGGVGGRLAAGSFAAPSDGLLLGPAGGPLAVRFGPEGTFDAADPLPPGQFIPATVLTDRQQRRQEVYRRLLGGPRPAHWEGRTLLMAWAESGELPFRAGDDSRSVGAALLVVPVEFERPAPDSPVKVPAALVTPMRLLQGRLRAPVLESSSPIEMPLRFQLPPAVVPLRVERATFTTRVHAPGRKVVVAAERGKDRVVLFEAVGPLDPVRLELTDPELLRPDADGGFHLTLSVGDAASKAAGDRAEAGWRIESPGLEVVGRTVPKE